MGRIMKFMGIAGAVAAVVMALPDLKRYLKISSM